MKQEIKFADFWIGSFYIDKEIHMRIFNDLMSYQKEMQPENQFKMLDEKYSEMYFGKKE
jgi:hypothetical protein